MISDDQREVLIAAARAARQHAYAPYSGYAVGAAVLTEDGEVVTGANIENASYGLTICAERAAIFTAVSAGARQILAIAIYTENACAPCGACRQVLSEFADDLPVYLCDTQGRFRETTLRALLPDHFGPEHLIGP